MISHVPIPLQSGWCDFVDFNWVGPHCHQVDREVYIFPKKWWLPPDSASAKGDCCALERQGSGGDQNPKRLSDWRIFCARLVFEEALKVQVPAQWWGEWGGSMLWPTRSYFLLDRAGWPKGAASQE